MTANDDTFATLHQDNVIPLADDLAELDAALLAQLDPVDRARQVRARQALWRYADAMWDAAKATRPGSEPGNLDGYNSVAALRDFSQELLSVAVEACRQASDPDPDSSEGPGNVDMWAERHTATGFAPPAFTLPDRPPATP